MPPLNPLSKSCVALAISQLINVPSVSHAATIPVNSNADNNGAGCTLREAIVSANTTTNQNNGCLVGSNSGTDTITFLNGLPSVITLTQGELEVGAGKDIEIDASNISGGVTIDASASFTRVIATTSATLVLDSLTITGGEQSGNGGGIYANASTLTLNNSTVSGNSAFRRGGGIYAVNSTLNLYDSSIDNNRTTGGESSGANGGGIYIGGEGGGGVSSLVLTNTVISNNSTVGSGGGINASYIASVALNNSTVSDNTASGYYSRGGGVSVYDGVNVTVDNSTLSGNSASYGGGLAVSYGNTSVVINNSTINANSVSNQAQGGGIGAFGSGVSVTLNNSTVSGNSSSFRSGGIHSYNADLTLNNVTVLGNLGVEDSIRGAGIYSSGRGDRLTINNSIIANSPGGAVCSLGSSPNGVIDSASIIEDGTCGANRSGDPGLLELADNGGQTQTHALAADSIAINTGDAATCLTTDQRGETRDISDGFCDIGAVELDASLVNDTTTFVIPLLNGKTVIFDL